MGLFDRLKQGLSRTREKITTGIRSALPVGKPIDEGVLDELQDTLLMADVGPVTVTNVSRGSAPPHPCR